MEFDLSPPEERQFLVPLWLTISALALGLVLLAILIAKRKSLAPGYFAPLLVTVVCFLVGTAGAALILPSVTVVSRYSSGEADDSDGETVEVGESTVR